MVHLAAALDLHLHPVGKRVDAAHADAVESAGDLVVRAVELAARVEDREHDLDRGAVLGRMHVDGNAAPVVLHGERPVGVDDDVDHRAVARESLVDRVVDHFVDEVVVTPLPRVADVHGGALADRLHALQDLYVLSVVVARLFSHLHNPSLRVYYTIFAPRLAICRGRISADFRSRAGLTRDASARGARWSTRRWSSWRLRRIRARQMRREPRDRVRSGFRRPRACASRRTRSPLRRR